MADQLLYNNERQTKDVNVSMPRGEDRHLPFKHVLGPEAAVKEARFHVVDNNDVVLISLSLEEHPTQWDFSTDDEGVIFITDLDTVSMDISSYSYGIELIDQTDLVYTPQRGKFDLSDDIVDNEGESPYLSWTTRETLDDEIDDLEADIAALALCGDCTFLTVALTGGESQLTVADATNMNGKDIRVILNTGYEDEHVSSVSGNVLTISGTVSGAAAVNSYVRIL